MIAIKRIYEPPADEDGYRVLVDRLWPRGLARERAGVDEWLKDIAPSTELRKWFGHDPARWDEFRRRYRAELEADAPRESLERLRARAADGPLTLLYAARDETHNNAAVIREMLLEDINN